MNSYTTLIVFSLSATLALNSPLQEFIKSNNHFASSLYSKLEAQESSNFLFSPLSAQTIWALAESGAKEDTAEEIRTGLNLPDSRESIEAALQSVQSSEQIVFQCANKIYVSEDYPIKDGFKKVAEEVFGTDVENINFGKEGAACFINQWVADKTQGKIEDLVKKEDLNALTKIVLVNALNFKSSWSYPFSKHSTRSAVFFKNGAEAIQVASMSSMARRQYFEDSNLEAKFLKLPFQDEDASLTVVLPNQKNGLSSLEKKLDSVLEERKYEEIKLEVLLPKFKIEASIDLKPLLQTLGVEKAFSDEADFTGIAEGDVFVDTVRQKAFIDVNEDGVEAAAATFIEIPTKSGTSENFVADHPFIFYLKYKGLVVFVGRVVDPSSQDL